MRKKILSLLVVSVLILCVLAGCAAKESSSAAPGKNYADGKAPAEDSVSDEDSSGRKDSFAPDMNTGNPESSGKKIIYTRYLHRSKVRDAMEENRRRFGVDGYIAGSIIVTTTAFPEP